MLNRSPLPHQRHRSLIAVAVLVAVTTVLAAAQPGDRSVLMDVPEAHPNFDIRTFKGDPRFANDTASAAYLARTQASSGVRAALAADRFAGQAALQRAFAGIVFEDNPALGTMEIVSAAQGKGFLTPPSGDRVGSLRAFLTAHAAAYGVSAAQVAELAVSADYMNPAGNMGYAEFEQRFHGIPVFQGLFRGGFTAKGELARTTGVLATGIDGAALPTTPSVNAAQAISLAAATVGWRVTEDALGEKSNEDGKLTFERATLADDSKAWLVYFPLGPGSARLAWETVIWGDPDSFLTVIDAETGTMLFRKNTTNYQTQSATYVVYPSDSPAPGSPTTATPDNHFQHPQVARQSFTLIGNEAPYAFNNLGWMTDGTNLTDGNNVEAGIDRDGINGVDAPIGGAARVFNFAYDPSVNDPLTAAYQAGDVTNMFYWVNRYHDLTYLLGFNEASRNFQTNNFGRGGLGNDRVSAEGQDSSGTNNANFSTVPDGTRGRMQMFLWTGPTPDRSGDLDQDVIFHELTHGLSNRLHANAAGLSTNMSGGMGEGWSDFYARSLLSDASENPNGVFTIGGWATLQISGVGYLDNYYYGIRRFPYAPRSATGGPLNRPFSPLTFADIDSTQADLTDGAYPRGPVGSATVDQVHNIGEVWAGMLWEVRARLVTRLGWATGNQRILQWVTDGMKLDPIGPTMLQARDSILAAASAGGATPADIADIWRGFATRGMGVLAQVTNAGNGANDTRVIESYLTPSDPIPTFTINDVSVVEGNAGTTNAVFTVTLTGGSASESRVSFATADGTATQAGGAPLTNGATITINDNAAAAPYPMAINVAGLTGTVTNVAVRLNGLTHTWPADIDALLVGPGGQQSLFMSDIGSGGDVSGIALTFQDGAPAPPTSQLAPGTVAPTNLDDGGGSDTFPAPAPAPTGATYNTPLAVFNGTNPNGTWNLYIRDDAAIDTGSISGGASLIITTTTSVGDYTGAAGQLIFPAGTTTQTITIPVIGDVTPEANEVFQVNLSAAINGAIGDAQAVGTIVNDDGGGTLPTAANDGYVTPVSTALVIAAPGVLANDSANGGGALSAAGASGPSHGILSIASNGGFTYTPTAAYTGPDSFTYYALNTFGGSLATVSITVGAVAPTTVNDALSTTYPSALNLAAPGVLANDNANGGGALTAALVSNVTNGTLTLGANGSVSYTPNFGFAGSDSFTYRAVSAGGNGNVATVTIAVAPPTNVQAPYNFRVDSIVGNTVTLRWDALPIGPQASTFILEGGAAPGQVLASIPTGNPAPIYTIVAPTGSWFIRMRGQLGSDTSAVSNEVPLFVNVPVTPSAPSSLTGLVNSSTLDLSWKNTFGGGAPSGMVLDVTGSATVSLPMGVTDRFSFTPVPGGSYTFRVLETNGGGASPASDPVTLTFPGGCTGAPETPRNFLGYHIGSTVYVIWDPPASGAAPTSYLLDVSGAFTGQFPTTGRALNGNAGPGSYTVRVQSVNACGASPFTAAQTVTIP